MRVRYQLLVPVFVEVDLAEGEVISVNVMDDSPVGGWENVQGRVEFMDMRAVEEFSRDHRALTGGEQLALRKAFKVADKVTWPAWEWGW
jgi:hypothetical protein